MPEPDLRPMLLMVCSDCADEERAVLCEDCTTPGCCFHDYVHGNVQKPARTREEMLEAGRLGAEPWITYRAADGFLSSTTRDAAAIAETVLIAAGVTQADVPASARRVP